MKLHNMADVGSRIHGKRICMQHNIQALFFLILVIIVGEKSLVQIFSHTPVWSEDMWVCVIIVFFYFQTFPWVLQTAYFLLRP